MSNNVRMPVDAEKVPQNSSDDFMKLEDGENHFRVLSEPVIGYEYWTEEPKPVRTKEKLLEQPKDLKI